MEILESRAVNRTSQICGVNFAYLFIFLKFAKAIGGSMQTHISGKQTMYYMKKNYIRQISSINKQNNDKCEDIPVSRVGNGTATINIKKLYRRVGKL